MGRLAAAVERGVRQWTDVQVDPSVPSRFKASLLHAGNRSKSSLISDWDRAEAETEFADGPHVHVRRNGMGGSKRSTQQERFDLFGWLLES